VRRESVTLLVGMILSVAHPARGTASSARQSGPLVKFRYWSRAAGPSTVPVRPIAARRALEKRTFGDFAEQPSAAIQ